MIHVRVLLLITLPIGLTPSVRPSPAPSSPQEQAQFLAGVPMPRSSSLAPLQKSPEYRAHRKELLERWRFCRLARYGPMQAWAGEHLTRYPSTRGVLRYLFGGPDFLNAHAFFPDARMMVLGGLEPVGEVPPPEALSPAELGLALKSLDEALSTSLFAGYFITSEMRPQLTVGAFRGVLPVLFTELALTGNIIESVSTERPFGSPGVRITYRGPGAPLQTLWYFQADLSNGKECRRFLSWLGELGPGASYLKAASYLLPLDSFSETRDFLTRTSDLILQDDSGLPFRVFLPGIWRLSLFGTYTDPLPIFGLKRDPALVEAYDSSLKAGSLPFGAGYHVNAADANLLLAVRSDGVAPVVTPPAFIKQEAAPESKQIPVRKALPVPIRRAIPVPSPSPDPSPSVTSSIEEIWKPQDASSANETTVQGVRNELLVEPEGEPSSEPVITTTPLPSERPSPELSPSPGPTDTESRPDMTPEATPSAQPEETPLESPSGQG